MSGELEDVCHRLREGLYAKYGNAGPATMALYLDGRGDLDPIKDALLQREAEALRTDREGELPAGALADACTIIAETPAAEAKQRVLAAGISRRTYFRARKVSAKSANHRPGVV